MTIHQELIRTAAGCKVLRPARAERRGAMLVLIAALLVVLVAMALFTVDVAYMQLTRSELRSAADAAAKAGAESLRRDKNPDKARQAVKSIAAKNTIGGRPLVVTDSEIELGATSLQSDGSWDFEPDKLPYTAVRVSTQMGGTSNNQPVRLFFADYFGSGTFEPARTSTAAHTSTEICLCIDRSHSMCFDMTGVDWSYPQGTPRLPHPVAFPPHPVHSRWGALMKATKDFAQVIKAQNPTPRVALVTWGSEITSSSYESRLTGLTFPAVKLDLPLSTNHGQFVSSLTGRSRQPMLGGTDMSAGMGEAISVLTASNVDPLASRIMILMSDGLWNRGTDPVVTARTAKANQITVHTISLLSSGNQSTLEDIAQITGGRFFSAANEDQLRNAFIEIARQLPVVLTD